MTETQRQRYSQQYQNMVKAFEERYIGRIYSALRKQVSSFTDVLKTRGIDAATSAVTIDLFNEQIYPVIRSLYKDAGLTNARKIRGELRLEQQKRFGRNDEMVQSILDYLERHILEKSVRPISDTTREWILRRIQEGVQDGKSPVEIANWIMKNPDNVQFLKYQALRIVRTETVRATNVGAIKAAETSPFEVEKEWISSHDARTRHSHRLVDGQKVDFKQPFSNGLMQPGDPKGPAKETINCRCTVGIRPKRDEDGRLIRTQRNIYVQVS